MAYTAFITRAWSGQTHYVDPLMIAAARSPEAAADLAHFIGRAMSGDRITVTTGDGQRTHWSVVGVRGQRDAVVPDER